jgi:AcrR family transcriptional regulator
MHGIKMADKLTTLNESAQRPDNYEEKRSLLLNRAIEIYSQKGDVTIRELATATGVNVAAINYYYRNKESLISNVHAYLISKLVDMAVETGNTPSGPREKLKIILQSYMNWFMENPGVSYFFYSVIGNRDNAALVLLNEFADANSIISKVFTDIISAVTGIKDDFRLYSRVLIAICALFPSGIFRIGQNTGGDLNRLNQTLGLNTESSPADRYIDTVVDTVLSEPW